MKGFFCFYQNKCKYVIFPQMYVVVTALSAHEKKYVILIDKSFRKAEVLCPTSTLNILRHSWLLLLFIDLFYIFFIHLKMQ